MQVVIMAGGLGTRLGPLTAKTPKSMVPVQGRPFLEHQVELLTAAGVDSLVLCIGHYGEQIVDHFGDGARFGLKIAYSQDGPSLLGTGGALRQAAPLLDEAFMLMWGDSYLLLDYAEVWQRFQAQDLPALMVVYRNDNQRVPSNVVKEGGRVAVYDKWAQDPAKVYVDDGLTALSREVLDMLPAQGPAAIEQVFADLAATDRLAAYETDQPFYEIGSPAGLAELEELLDRKRDD